MADPLLSWRDLIMGGIGAVIREIVQLISKHVGRGREEIEKRKRSRGAVASHMRRVGREIDGLDTHITAGRLPSIAHVQRVRRTLAERDDLRVHLENIGDADLEREARDWYQLTDSALHFAEDYVSGDSQAPSRYRVDWPEWNERWKNQYALHARQIIAMDRIANQLEGKDKPPKARTTTVPPEAMLPSALKRPTPPPPTPPKGTPPASTG